MLIWKNCRKILNEFAHFSSFPRRIMPISKKPLRKVCLDIYWIDYGIGKLDNSSFHWQFKILLHWAIRIFTPLALIALSWAAWNARETLVRIVLESKPLLLLAAVGLWMMVHFIGPVFTALIFRSCQQILSYRQAFLIHANRLPAKYLPGGIWHSVARAADYHGQGINGRPIAIYLLIENFMAAATTLAMGGFIVAGLSSAGEGWRWAAGLLAFFGVVTLLLLPWIVNRHLIQSQGGLALKLYCMGVICGIANWTIAGAAFALYLTSFPALELSTSLVEAAGIYIFAWGVGFITLFAPQGIGIAEFTSAQLLSATHSFGTLATLLAGFRVIVLCADLLAWALSLLISNITILKKSASDTHPA
jgi:hypothetical protein